jgi:surface carbohydrate biosynthesis protein
MFKIFIKKIKKLWKTKFLFHFPNKKEILLYDESNSQILKEIIKKDFNILKIREIEIYFWIFIKQIIFFDFSYTTYCKNYIKYVSPKVMISINDGKIRFYELKKTFKNISFIVIQSGARSPETLESFNLFKAKKFKCDFFFVINEYYIKEYQKFISSNYHILGAWRNNIVKVNKSVKDDFLLISNYDPHTINKQRIVAYNKLLKLLNLYFSSSNKKIHILCRRKNSTQKEEMQFYKFFFGSNCVFHKTLAVNWKKSYRILDKFENIISMESTMGYEAISRKKKLAAFPPHLGHKYWFGWPKPFQKKYNFFVSKNFSYNEIKRVLDNVSNCSQSNWEKKYYNSIKDLQPMSTDNMVFRKILSNLLKN